MALPDTSTITKALTDASLKIDGACIVTDVSVPCSFFRCGSAIVRVDWAKDAEQRKGAARDAIFGVSGGDIVEVIE